MPGTAPASSHILRVSMSSLMCYLRQLVPDRSESLNLFRVTVRFCIGLVGAAAALHGKRLDLASWPVSISSSVNKSR
jgi:hypothetical protein